jgi:hypothetical protein
MNISEQPTEQILVRAQTNSEWDNCDYAVIECNVKWAEEIRERLLSSRLYLDNDRFHHSVDFHVSNDIMDDLLQHNQDWAFVEDDDNDYGFPVPESVLIDISLILYSDGSGRYIATGKFTGEKYTTEFLPLGSIAESILSQSNRMTGV